MNLNKLKLFAKNNVKKIKTKIFIKSEKPINTDYHLPNMIDTQLPVMQPYNIQELNESDNITEIYHHYESIADASNDELKYEPTDYSNTNNNYQGLPETEENDINGMPTKKILKRTIHNNAYVLERPSHLEKKNGTDSDGKKDQEVQISIKKDLIKSSGSTPEAPCRGIIPHYWNGPLLCDAVRGRNIGALFKYYANSSFDEEVDVHSGKIEQEKQDQQQEEEEQQEAAEENSTTISESPNSWELTSVNHISFSYYENRKTITETWDTYPIIN